MTQHLKHPFYSYSLVFLQFAFIAAILLTGKWFAVSYNLAWQIAAAAIGLWALQSMHLGHFNIIPDPKPDSELVRAGPYRLIRHPMYLSILLFFAPLVLEAPDPLRLTLLTLLSVTLLLKLHYEERLLLERFADYAEYQQNSHKLIPFVY